MDKISKDRITGMIAQGIGIVIIVMSLQLPPSTMPDDPGPAVFPILAAIVMILSGFGLIIPRPDESKKGPYLNREERIRFAKLLAILFLYFILLWLFGFVPSTIVVLFAISCMFLEGQKLVIWKQILYSVVITFMVLFCFQTFLGFRLPQGILFRLEIF